MDRIRDLLLLQIIFLIRLSSTYIAFAQDDEWSYYCNDKKYINVTVSRTMSINQRQVLDYLANTNTEFTYGFANFSAGETPNTVNGIALCVADLGHDACVNCLSDARRRLIADCQNEIEAIGWYYNCMLRYSNRSIFSNLETRPNRNWLNTRDASYTDSFNRTLGSLMERISREAATNVGELGRFARGQENVTSNLTIYGQVQCTPYLTDIDCSTCLAGAIRRIPTGHVRARFYCPSCLLRYEIYNFFIQQPEGRALVPSPGPARETSRIGSGEGNNKKNIVVIVALIVSAAAALVAFISVLGVYRWCRIKRERQEEQILLHGSEPINEDDMHFFNLKTIQEATNNFSIENKLGQGGFGPVYKGKLNDGRVVAVKRLSVNSGQGLREFRTEVRLIVKLQHKNLVKLLGCCTQKGEKLLVYEFMPNNSLDTFLFDKEKSKELDWSMRANIISGIAKGLRYLHEDSRLRIVHRDMKASNVLLDHEMNAKISDFGTARIFGGNQIEADTNRIVGTYGYMAPEYAVEGVFSTKSDVYSFGVLLLEIITSQKNNGFSHPEHQNLQSYAWTMWEEGTTEKLIDDNIRETCLVPSEATRWTNIALLCIQENPNDRPAMSSVVFMLERQYASLPEPPEPPFSVDRLINMSDQSSSTGTGAGSIQFYTSYST